MPSSLRNFNLAEWLHYLETIQSVEIQLGLTRVSEVARRLKVLSPDCKVITVAGTNGKGSTVAALEAIYMTAGYRTGSYTSPHLMYFNERIRINAVPASDKDLCSALLAVEEARQHISLTYFEMVTLAALWHFKACRPEVIILEVGLGGRQDATNILDADLAIISGIDFDHQQYLGNTLESIGYEKAGILRPKQTFIYADDHPPISVLKEAEQLNCQMLRFGQDYSIDESSEHWCLNFNNKRLYLPRPRIQLKAAASAIVASSRLQAFLPIEEKHWQASIGRMAVAGRLEFLPGRVNIIFDVSHNPQAVCLLAEYIKKLENKKRVHAVFSALNDKDLAALVSLLKDEVHCWYPAQLNLNRAASRQMILRTFKKLGVLVEGFYADPVNAFLSAQERADEGDLIVVYGSFHTVSPVRKLYSSSLEQEEI